MFNASNRAITLPAIAWQIILMMLQQPGWASTPRDIFVAGHLDEKLVLPAKPKPEKDGKLDPKKDAAWCAKPVKFELMGKEIDVIAKCVKKAIEATNVGAGRTAKQIVEAFLPDEC